jgi:four helix bundle suffix protein
MERCRKQGLIPVHGGYRKLKSFQVAQLAYDVTVRLAVACSLLSRQLAAQEKAFEQQGGFTERLYRVRSQKHSGNSPA